MRDPAADMATRISKSLVDHKGQGLGDEVPMPSVDGAGSEGKRPVRQLLQDLQDRFIHIHSTAQEIMPVHLLRAIGIIDGAKYVMWRNGELETLDDAIKASSREIRLLTNHMRQLAEKMGCEHIICRFIQWGSDKPLRFSTRNWLNQMLAKGFKPRVRAMSAMTQNAKDRMSCRAKPRKAPLDEWLEKNLGGTINHG